MTLPDGYSDVPPGKIAAVVTHLEMLATAPSGRAPKCRGGPSRQSRQPDVAWYRDLYARVGAEDWLWFSRLR